MSRGDSCAAKQPGYNNQEAIASLTDVQRQENLA